MAPTGVIVAQLGGPEGLDDVEDFIRAIFGDPRLVPLPGGRRVRSALSTLIARTRAPKVRARYAAIGGGSPIVATTQHQADALARALEGRGHDVVVAVAHRHSSPDTEAALDTMEAGGVDQIILLPLFPQYSATTTGSSEAELRRLLARRRPDPALRVIRSWCEHPSYLDRQARLVEEILAPLTAEERERGLLVFSAHGLPQRIVDRGDPYLEEVEATVAGILKRLGHPTETTTLAFQSRTGPVKWLEPDVSDVVAAAGAEGRPWVGVVPISFVSEHLETLHELDIELKAHAQEVGVGRFSRARCLDRDPGVGPMLADIVEEAL